MHSEVLTSFNIDSLSQEPKLTGRVFGRILRGKGGPPAYLASEAERRIAMVMGPSGLGHLRGKSAQQMLVEIGYTKDYIERLSREGIRFYLLVFKCTVRPRLATWENVIAVASEVYPELSQLFKQSLPELKSLTLAQLEAACGYALAAVDLAGADDPRFMTAERLLASEGTAHCVRRFLYHCCRLSDLYSGDGLTTTYDGRRGMREYVMPNVAIASLSERVIYLLEPEVG